MTVYHILAADDADSYSLLGAQEAHSPEDAVQAFLTKSPPSPPEGEAENYVAVADRSWAEVTAEIVSVTRVRVTRRR